MNPELVHALDAARHRTTADAWRSATQRVSTLASAPDAAATEHVIAGIRNPDAAWALKTALARDPQLPGVALGAAMVTVDQMDFAESPRTELIWTGPGNNRFPIRRIDQVLYDRIATAQRRILLVTFAARRVPHLYRHLEAALLRRVGITLVVESEEESVGQLTRDARAAFDGLLGAKVYAWALARRERNAAGRPGKLHAKCAVTDDAFNRNMELGLLVREPATVQPPFRPFPGAGLGRVLVRVGRHAPVRVLSRSGDDAVLRLERDPLPRRMTMRQWYRLARARGVQPAHLPFSSSQERPAFAPIQPGGKHPPADPAP